MISVCSFSVHKEYTTKFYLFFILPAWRISIKFRAHTGALERHYFSASSLIFLLCFIILCGYVFHISLGSRYGINYI